MGEGYQEGNGGGGVLGAEGGIRRGVGGGYQEGSGEDIRRGVGGYQAGSGGGIRRVVRGYQAGSGGRGIRSEFRGSIWTSSHTGLRLIN